MLGAAIGGILLGRFGDRVGRTRAMAGSILFYSVFAGLGAYVTTLEQLLVLRFLVGLGVGGMWPNGVALVSECWPGMARPGRRRSHGRGDQRRRVDALAIGADLADHTRLVALDFSARRGAGALGIFTLVAVPESPTWLAARAKRTAHTDLPAQPSQAAGWRELFRPPLLRLTLVGILLGTIPLVGAWAASKWMIPWADEVGGSAQPGYKAVVQGWWALGATMGSFFGAQIASILGRRVPTS